MDVLLTTTEPLVKRPAIKGKKRSAARISFAGGTSMADDNDDEDAPSVVVSRSKGTPGLSRQGMATNSIRKPGLSSSRIRATASTRQTESQPTYSKEYLDSLKQSTPSAPQPASSDLMDFDDDNEAPTTVDVAAKFGPQATSQAIDVAAKFSGSALTSYESSNTARIPTDAEIQEKKARRARLAHEQQAREGASDSDSEAGGVRLAEPRASDATDSEEDGFRAQRDTITFQASGTTTSQRKRESRLVREDADFMEDDSAYPTRGTIAMNHATSEALRSLEKAQMRALIDAAEGGGGGGQAEDGDGGDSDATSDSEVAACEAYEAAQTRRGMDRALPPPNQIDDGTFVPRILPLPTLTGVMDRLKGQLERLQQEHAADVARLEECARERQSIVEAERGVDTLLADIQRRWTELVQSGEFKGLGDLDGGMRAIAQGSDAQSQNQKQRERGLEMMGE